MMRPRAPSAYSWARAQDRAADARRLLIRAHDEQREPPDALAQQRQRAAGESLLVLGHPRTARVGAHQVAVADVRHRRVGARLGRLAAALRRDPRTCATFEVVDGRDVVLEHRADHRHAAKTRIGAMSSFSLDGQRLAYTVHGEGPRLTVLLHGLLFSQRMHEALARALAERGHRVVTLDLLGHGESDRPRDKWRYSMPAFGAQVVALLDHLGERRGRRARHLAGRQRRARGRRRRRRSACAGW